MSDVYKETARRFVHRHIVVGVSLVKLVNTTGFQFVKGIQLRAPGSFDPIPNTACIWVGGAAVSADSDIGTGGMPIAPGESMFIPINFEETELYLVSTAADQDIAWFGV